MLAAILDAARARHGLAPAPRPASVTLVGSGNGHRS
jgi:hypothetical protein